MAGIECGGFLFYSNFDSGNLQKVEWVPKNESAVVVVTKNGKEVPEIPDMEFNIWTRPDCMGTEFENGNRTWFHFGVKSYLPYVLIKLNLVDLNRQAKMYSQGMAPVFRLVPGRPNWDRVRDKPTYTITDNIFTLSFKFRTPENIETVMYFAFTYPYTYTELQTSLLSMDNRFIKRPSPHSYDDIYYVRECVCKSLEHRRIDLITISSYFNITPERETRLIHLFPDQHVLRPFKFYCKKVIFISARVHPGETPASFVFNGLLNFLLTRDDPIAVLLRRMYVFKMIPFLNPDGVVKGHYRTDTRGVNLNRMYLCPTLAEHPSIYAARALIQYYHKGYAADDDDDDVITNEASFTSDNNKMTQQVEVLSLDEKDLMSKRKSEPWCSKWNDNGRNCDTSLLDDGPKDQGLKQHTSTPDLCSQCYEPPIESGLFLYLDMHGHASKKGIFMYGNHFTDIERNVECMLLPKIMSLNNHNFHFTSCNFTERNMYLRDRRDGMSREGSGRVAVLKLTGLIQSYTLECNYNSGRMVNVLPPMVKEINKNVHTMPIPPKYTPHIFEEAGRAIGISILDLTAHNPNSRLPNSEFHSLSGLREWLRVNCLNEYGSTSRISNRSKLPPNSHSQASAKPVRVKTLKTLAIRARPSTVKANAKKVTAKSCIPVIPVERKENMMFAAKESNLTSQSSSSPSSAGPRLFSHTGNKNLSLRSRSKRDLTHARSKVRLKTKQGTPPQLSNRSDRSVQTSNTTFELEPGSSQVKISPKRIKVTPNSAEKSRLKLKEICIIKENLGKKLIAKFENLDKKDSHDDDDLVVAWDSSYSPRVHTQSSKAEASTSKRGGYKTATFNKSKMAKGTVRRLSASVNIDLTGKIDKIKKRKKKSKFL